MTNKKKVIFQIIFNKIRILIYDYVIYNELFIINVDLECAKIVSFWVIHLFKIRR